MSGRDRPIPPGGGGGGGGGSGGSGAGGGGGGMGRLMDKIKRTVSAETDETRDPLQRGYQRVETDPSLSTSSTATSLDTVLLEQVNELRAINSAVAAGQRPGTILPIGTTTTTTPASGDGNDTTDGQSQSQQQTSTVRTQQPYQQLKAFSPILESDEPLSPLADTFKSIPEKHSSLKTISLGGPDLKGSLKSSKVSFDKSGLKDDSDEDNFENRRLHFQAKKAKSADHRGILKDLNHLSLADTRRAFQSKKHVSLDYKNSKVLERILRGSSSDEEDFQDRRKQFQSKKHKSLDARVKFNLDNNNRKFPPSSSDSDLETEGKGLIPKERIHDFNKPIIIDVKDLQVSESSTDEDDDDEEDEEQLVDEEAGNFSKTREHFQQNRSISTDSRKSKRFYEMDDMGGKKNENIRQAVPFVRQITQDGKPKLEVYRPTTNPIYIYTQIVAALAVSVGSMIVGFSSGYTSPALPSMKESTNTTAAAFEMTENEETWIGSIMPLAGLFGGIAGGPLIEYFGRKTTILGTGIPFAVSYLLIGCAVNVYMVLVGRAVTGFCIGIASLAFPVYLGETLQAEVRGTLGLLPTAFGNTGILISYGAGIILNWSGLAFLGCSLAVPFMIAVILIPETPRWYVSRGRDDNARKALQWLRGKKADVEPELKGIMKTHNESERHASSNGLAQLMKRCNLKPLSISLGLMLFQQFSGINAVIFYAVDIFKQSGSGIDSNVSSLLIGVVNFAATFMATLVIDRFGRKMLLYISSVGMIITLGALGGYFYAQEHGSNVESLGWIPLASLMVYVLCFSLGFGPIPWLMMGEILPAKIRGSAASVATGFNWSITFLVTKLFGLFVGFMGLGGVFLLFCSFCIVGVVFVVFCVPETQGKSLEEIERKMMGRVRRMSSVANIRPLSFNM